MKISKIKSLCNNAKRIVFFNTGAVQYISEGHGIYPLYNMPRLSEDNIFCLFDIPEKNRGKIHFEEKGGLPIGFDISDRTEEELELTPLGVTIWYHGKELYPYISNSGVVFLNSKFLEPFSDFKNGFCLTEREMPNGASYVAVKDGMLLSGFVLPEDVATDELSSLFANLGARIKRESERGSFSFSLDDCYDER